MNDYDGGDSYRTGDYWNPHPRAEAADMIREAIKDASMMPVGGHAAHGAEPSPILDPFGQCSDDLSRGRVKLPPVADAIVLDILPVSTMSFDDAGRAQIDPDAPSLRAWERTNREAAEHLISWVNESGKARDAIEHAIGWGSRRFQKLSSEYDDRLAQAGYDRSAPDVRACDNELKDLHEAIQHAKGVLDDLRGEMWRGTANSSSKTDAAPFDHPPADSFWPA